MVYKVAIIGLGKIACLNDIYADNEYIFSHAKAYMNNQSFQIVAGVDTNINNLNKFHKFTKSKVYTKIEDIDEIIDVVSLCTPSHLRIDIIKKIINKLSPKLIIIEKPIALNMEEALQIKEFLSKYNVKIMINYIRRFLPSFINLKNELNNLKSVVITYNDGLFNTASHFIDLMLFYFNTPNKVINISTTKIGIDYASEFIMQYKDFNIYFIPIKTNKYNLGEIEFFLETKKIEILDRGFKIMHKFPQLNKNFENIYYLDEISIVDNNDMFYNLKYTIEYARLLLEDRVLSNVDDAIQTIKICEDLVYETI